MNTTTNYKLKKPEGNDYYDIEIQNSNMDVIDARLRENDVSIADTKDSRVTFTEASADTDIASGDTHAALFGKLLKRLNSIKAWLSSLTVSTTELNNCKGTKGSIQEQIESKADAGHNHTKSEITDFPTAMPPTAHTHTKSQITDFPTAMTPVSHASTGTGYGVSSASNYGHSKAGASAPLMDGTAAAGTDNGQYARADHRHPVDTSRAAASHTHTKSQITDFPTTMPASDVYAWAKQSSKPSYAYSEITGKPSSFTPAAHNQAAGTITAGTLPAGVLATNSTDYTASRLRNIQMSTTDLTAGSSSLANGAIYMVYE